MSFSYLQAIAANSTTFPVLLGSIAFTLAMLSWNTFLDRQERIRTRLRLALRSSRGGNKQSWIRMHAAQISALLLGKNGQTDMSRLLASAGIHHKRAVVYLALTKWLFGAGSVGGVLWYTGVKIDATTIAFGAFAFVFGGSIPERWLAHKAKAIRKSISATIPDALDLLVACIEAGLTLDRGLERVGEELAQVSPALAKEFLVTHNELLITGNRKKSLYALANRIQVQELENLAYTLAQSDRYGTPMAPALRIIAEESRTNRILEMEEQIGKLPAKMSLPLIGLVLFPLVVLMIAPPLIMTMRLLGGD